MGASPGRSACRCWPMGCAATAPVHEPTRQRGSYLRTRVFRPRREDCQCQILRALPPVKEAPDRLDSGICSFSQRLFESNQNFF